MSSGCGIASVGVAWPKWVWHDVSGFGVVLVGVAWTQWVWHVLSGCSMFVACLPWVWYILSEGAMSPVGVSMASICVFMACKSSVGVSRPEWVLHGINEGEAFLQSKWHCLTACGMASLHVEWPHWVWHGLMWMTWRRGCCVVSELFQWVCLFLR